MGYVGAKTSSCTSTSRHRGTGADGTHKMLPTLTSFASICVRYSVTIAPAAAQGRVSFSHSIALTIPHASPGSARSTSPTCTMPLTIRPLTPRPELISEPPLNTLFTGMRSGASYMRDGCCSLSSASASVSPRYHVAREPDSERARRFSPVTPATGTNCTCDMSKPQCDRNGVSCATISSYRACR